MTTFEVKSEKANGLFSRREMSAVVSVEGATPTRKSVVKLISEKLPASEDCIVLEKIEHRFGTRGATVYFKVYEKPEMAKREPAYKFERGSGVKKAPAEKQAKKPKK